MSESAKVQKFKDKEVEPGLVLELDDDSDLAEGERRILPCGLGVVVAPTNTQEFSQATAAAVRKFGGRRSDDISDLKPQKRIEAMLWIMGKATFKAFYDPETDKADFSVRVKATGEVRRFNGNTLENRIALLRSFPVIREQINDEVTDVTESLGEEMEGASGN